VFTVCSVWFGVDIPFSDTHTHIHLGIRLSCSLCEIGNEYLCASKTASLLYVSHKDLNGKYVFFSFLNGTRR